MFWKKESINKNADKRINVIINGVQRKINSEHTVLDFKLALNAVLNLKTSARNVHVYFNNKELTKYDEKIGEYYKIREGSKLTVKADYNPPTIRVDD